MQFPFKITENSKFDVVGFGTNAVDYLIRVPEYPAFNTKIELTESTRAVGGEVASTMAGLSRLGLKTAYAGRFGDDEAGDLGITSLVEEGVDISFIERISGAATQIAFIIIDERSGERTVIWKRDAKLAYLAEDAPISAAVDTRVLHITPHDAAACTKLAETARSTGAIVSLDIDNLFDGFEKLLPLVDVLVASADFPARICGLMGLRDSLRELRNKFGSGLVGVTLGEAGSLMLCGDSFIETPGFSTPGGCIDTTGAGDAFRAGLLFGLLSGESVEESALVANAVAALKCGSVGARTALPTREELFEFLSAGRQ